VLSKADGTLTNSGSDWTEASVNLADYAGLRIRVVFKFDTVDAVYNQYEGWYVDDVRIKQYFTASQPDLKLTGPAMPNGLKVAGIGDFNGDGRDDLAILAQTDSKNFTLSLFQGKVTRLGGSLPIAFGASNGFTGYSLIDNEFFVYRAGNVDGDNNGELALNDLVVTSRTDTGLVFGGSLSGMTTFDALLADGEAALSVGKVLQGIGDFDNDGLADLGGYGLEASPQLNELDQNDIFLFNYHQIGHVFLGAERTQIDLVTPDIVLQPGKPDFILPALSALMMGNSQQFAGLGDINADGYSDVALADALGGRLNVYLGQTLTPVSASELAGAAPEAYLFDLATPLLPSEQPRSGLTLPNSSLTPLSLGDAFGLSGVDANQELSVLGSVGDINGDGFEDFAASGKSQSYILLGPVELTGLEDVATRAEMIVDAATLGRVVGGSGDLNGDGLDDLVFSRTTSTSTVITVVFGKKDDWSRSLSTSTVPSNERFTLTLNGEGAASTVALLTWNGDARADLLINTYDQAYIVSGTSFSAGGSLTFTDNTFNGMHRISRDGGSAVLNAGMNLLGDINGDGLDDVMFTDSSNGYLLLGRNSPTGAIALTTGANAVFAVDDAKGEVFALGDVNHDGYDDFAIGGDTDSETRAGLLIYFGSDDYRTNETGLNRDESDADLEVRHRALADLAGGLSYESKLRVTAGDFNADGKSDLAVVESGAVFGIGGNLLEIFTRPRVWVDYSFVDEAGMAGGDVNLSMAEVILEGEQDLSLFDLFNGTYGNGHSLGSPHLDLDRDGMDDLLIGFAKTDQFGEQLVTAAGRIYALYGTPRTISLPDLGAAIPLVNTSIPGAGDFLIGRDGAPIEFGVDPLELDIDGDGYNDFRLSPGEHKWFRFTTQGDGKAGNEVRVLMPAEAANTTTLHGEDAHFDAGAFTQPDTFTLGVTTTETGVIEIDLSGYLDRIDRPETITDARLVLDYVQPTLPIIAANAPKLTIDGILYFAADGGDGVELWKSDGTVLGTRQVKDIEPQRIYFGAGSLPYSSSPDNFVEYNGLLYFTAYTINSGVELWRSDGTAAGTYLVKDIYTGSTSSDPGELTVSNGLLYFAATSSSAGRELWRSNGTTAGTLQVANIFSDGLFVGSSNPAELTDVNGVLYFTANNGTNGIELWRSQGSSLNTTRLGDINPGSASSSPVRLAALGDRVFFSATDGSGRELWSSDIEGPSLVEDIADKSGSVPSSLFNAGEALLFSANDEQNGAELWAADKDGTFAELLANINQSGSSSPQNFVKMGDVVYFTANDNTHGRELWSIDVSNGKLGRPQLFADIANAAFVGSDPAELTVIGGKLYFTASADGRTRTLWVTKGEGVSQVDSTAGNPSNLGEFNGKLVFMADVAGGGRELWFSNGSPSSTMPLSQAGLMNRTLQVNLLQEEGDARINLADGSEAATLAGSRHLSSVYAGTPIEVDISAAVREALASGKTRLTLRYGLDGVSPALPLTVISSLAADSATGVQITTAQQDGVLVDLYDASGALLKEAVSIADLRETEAGTFYLRVYNPFAATQTTPLDFQIEITAPLAGQYHALTDHDTIHGGDGNDILIGNKHIDFLFGDNGEDVFLAEGVEVRDLDTGEFMGGATIGEDIYQSQYDLFPLDAEVHFDDINLQVAIAHELDIPVTVKWNGTPLVQAPIMASDMITLTRLDFGGMGISDITGLEFATNLISLNLANNQVVDLFTLTPRTLTEGPSAGSVVGHSKLEYLALDYNGLASIAPLANILGLKALSLDGNPLVSLSPIAQWREILPPNEESPLTFLSLDHTGIGSDVEGGLLGEYYAGSVSTFYYPDLRFLDPTHSRVDAGINIPNTAVDFAGYSDLDGAFAARWTGQIEITTTGDVTFSTAGNGFERIYLDGQLIIDSLNNAGDADAKMSASLYLAEGWHDIQIEYVTFFVAGGLVLSYDPANGPLQVVPPSALRSGDADLDAVKGLSNLRILSASHNSLTDAAPVSWLDALEIAYLNDNAIQDIGALAGGRLVDDGQDGFALLYGSDWLENRRPVAQAFNTDYRFHDDNGAALAEWTFSNVRPGRYEVFVTWPEDASRNSQVFYSVQGDSGSPYSLMPENGDYSTLTVNQRFAPDGAVVAGRPWQSLGVFNTQDDAVRVLASMGYSNGSMAADAVRLVALDPVLPSIRHLDITDNPLGNDSQIQYAPVLAARDAADPDFTFLYDANAHAPVWASSGLIAPQGSRGETVSISLSGKATDADGDLVTYTATADTSLVNILIIGSELFLTPQANFVGTARITLVAQDGTATAGSDQHRTAEQTFDFNVDVGAIYGNKFNDLNLDGVKNNGEPGIEGWTIYLDANGNGQLDSGERSTLTDANGDYRFTDLTPFTNYTVAEMADAAWVQTSPLDASEITLVDDLMPGVESSYPSGYTEYDGDIYFAAQGQRRVWVEGLPFLTLDAGFNEFNAINAIGDIGDIGGIGVGYWQTQNTGNELWRMDGETGAVTLVVDLYDGVNSSNPNNLTVFNDQLYFSANGNDGAGNELWRYDAATDEVTRITDIHESGSSSPSNLVVMGDKLYFAATGNYWRYVYHPGTPFGFFVYTEFNVGRELFSYNGTSWTLEADINDSAAGASSSPSEITVFNNALYFRAYDSDSTSNKLWKFADGNASMVTEPRTVLNLGGGSSIITSQTTITNPYDLTIYNGRLYFSANAYSNNVFIDDFDYGNEIWSTNGTSMSLAANIASGAGESSYPYGLTVYQDKLYFSADGQDGYGYELWSYNSVDAAATRVSDLSWGSGSSSPYDLTVFDGNLYFSAYTVLNFFGFPLDLGNELLTYNGANFNLVTDNGPESGLGSYPYDMFVFNGGLYFTAYGTNTVGEITDGVGYEMWRYGPQNVAGAHTVYVRSGQGMLNTFGLDFGNFQVADAGADQRIEEGDTVTLTGLAFEPYPEVGSDFGFEWTVTDPYGNLVEASQTLTPQGLDVSFQALDDGDYTATLTVIDYADGSMIYTDAAHIFVDNVAPSFSLGDAASLNAGIAFSRTVNFDDPGSDTWLAAVNYGDGSDTEYLWLDTRSFGLEHSYATPGEYQIDVTLYDDDGGQMQASLAIAVQQPIPTAQDDAYTLLEDGQLVVNAAAGVRANDSDPDGNTLAVTLLNDVQHGTLALAANGAFVYTPMADFYGSDSFTYYVSNGYGGMSEAATVEIEVIPVNDAPAFVAGGNLTLDEDAPAQVMAWAGGISAGPANETQALSFEVVVDHPALFSVQPSVSTSGELSFVLAANASGVAHIGLRLVDDGGTADGGADRSPVHVLTLTVLPVNDAPAGQTESFMTLEDHAVAGNVLTNDSDLDDMALAAELQSGPVHGALAFNADGSFSYTPSADFNGVDSFTYRVFDGSLYSDPISVELQVSPVNDAPSFQVGPAVVVNEDAGARTFINWATNLAAGGRDEARQSLSFDLVGNDNPTLFAQAPTLAADGTLSFTVTANASGIAHLALVLRDDGGTANGGVDHSAAQLFTITIDPVNDAPVGVVDNYVVDEDGVLVAGGIGVLANDSDIDSASLEARLVSGPQQGQLVLNADGSFRYTPNANYHGADGFSYRVWDGQVVSGITSVMISVNPVNDAPNAVDDVFSGNEDSPIVGNLLANDSDVEGDPMLALLVGGPAHGSLALDSVTGSFVYTPDANFHGSDSFTYQVNDSAIASVSITVHPVVDAPTLAPVEDRFVQAGDVVQLALLGGDADGAW
jgi:ELWxxDGT repeat protein